MVYPFSEFLIDENKNIDDVFECDSFEEFDKLIINHSIELLVSNILSHSTAISSRVIFSSVFRN